VRFFVLLIFSLFGTYGWCQVGFIENKGQFHPNVNYEVTFHTSKIYLEDEGFKISLHNQEQWKQWIEEYHEHEHNEGKTKVSDNRTLEFHTLFYEFVNADLSNVKGVNANNAHLNYFVGKDASKWKSEVKKYQKIYYTNIYPNIDLEVEAIDQRFKYNFLLKYGADINDIQVRVKGADNVKIGPDEILVNHRFGSFREVMPLCYIQRADSKEKINLTYEQVNDATFGFSSKTIKTGTSVVIDPELIFSTYSGSTVDNFGFTATFDSLGNLYAGGISTEPTTVFNGRYPATLGAYDVTFNGGVGVAPANLPCDITISKYDSSGQNLLYATYLGGVSDEYPHSMVVNSQNELIVYGTTYSADFPTTAGVFQPLKRGSTDILISKFSNDGSTLLGSSYLGGSGLDGLNQSGPLQYFYADDFRGEINLDTNDNIYVATCTRSTDIVTTPGVFQSTHSGGQDGLLFALSPDVATLKWCSYFGGSRDDAIYSVDVAADGTLFISGGTSSADLPSTGGSVGETYHGGVADGFVSHIQPDGTSVLRSGYWGTGSYDQILSLELDKFGNVFVVGQSEGQMDAQGSVYFNLGGKQFISKFNADLDRVLLTTIFGSGRNRPDITVNAFLVDECGKIFVSGWGGSLYMGPTSPLGGMPLTPDALQNTTDGNDFYLAVFRRDMLELLYATYFGGTRTDDHVDGGTSRFDKKGIIYQSVCSSCPPSSDGQQSQVSDFPTTDGAFSEFNPSPRCSNASFKLAFGNLNRKPHLEPQLYEVTALDTLDFIYTVTDPDQDTINVFIDYPDAIKEAFINRQEVYTDVERVDASFSISPDCIHIGDTFTIPVYALDRGCPAAKDSLSFFQIVVNPPPVQDPPEVLCLNFVNQNTVRIEWEGLQPSRYFKQMYLYKRDPNGNTTVIDTIYTQGNGSFTDPNVINPRERNYSYYLAVENRCDSLGPKSYDLSSVKESEVPVESTYLKTVTVDEQQLKIVWLRSNEDDFGHYEIYKHKRGKGELVYLTSIFNIEDTVYYDTDVDINNQSYCYEIRVSDNCGHLSRFSNIGCSIVLRGDSKDAGPEVKPRFFFDLYWDEYLSWKGEVEAYELKRSVDTGALRPIVRTDYNIREYRDADLDFDWGGYWFNVEAIEGPGSLDATSKSNKIYLIQPPLVFVPNAVTSNGDQLNDVFGWSDVFVKEFEMRIYNRWGEKIFETTDKNKEWDGDYRKPGLKNTDVYVWVVTYKGWDNRRYIKKGTVTILR
jgi:gliding motility-associated-like protein